MMIILTAIAVGSQSFRGISFCATFLKGCFRVSPTLTGTSHHCSPISSPDESAPCIRISINQQNSANYSSRKPIHAQSQLSTQIVKTLSIAQTCPSVPIFHGNSFAMGFSRYDDSLAFSLSFFLGFGHSRLKMSRLFATPAIPRIGFSLLLLRKNGGGFNLRIKW